MDDFVKIDDGVYRVRARIPAVTVDWLLWRLREEQPGHWPAVAGLVAGPIFCLGLMVL